MTSSTPGRLSLILVPDPDALVQDLGPFLSGRLMETDILPGSALVCAAPEGQMVPDEEGCVRLAFEGNANGACNLERFHEKAACAAGRLYHRAPSIAFGRAPATALTPVALYDMSASAFLEVFDADRLERWSGEAIATYLPQACPDSPCQDGQEISARLSLPLEQLYLEPAKLMMWKFANGDLLTMEGPKAPTTLWARNDPGIQDLLERHNIADALASRIAMPHEESAASGLASPGP